MIGPRREGEKEKRREGGRGKGEGGRGKGEGGRGKGEGGKSPD